MSRPSEKTTSPKERGSQNVFAWDQLEKPYGLRWKRQKFAGRGAETSPTGMRNSAAHPPLVRSAFAEIADGSSFLELNVPGSSVDSESSRSDTRPRKSTDACRHARRAFVAGVTSMTSA